MNAKLTVRQESGRVTEFPVTKDEIKIGRTSARNDLVLDDLSVSREHAVISRNGDVFTVTDLRSANGTFVNGVMLEGSVVWNAGDEVVIGKTTLLLETEKPAPPPAPAKKAVDDIRFGEIHDVDGTIMVSLVPEQLFSALKPITASHSAVQREREREKERESGIFKAKPPIAAAAPEAFDETATKKPGPMEPEEELRRLRKKEEILSLLYELGNVLSSSFTLDEIYKKASEMLFRVTPADHCVILLGENVESLTPVSTAKSPSLLEREQGSSRQNIVVSRTITARVMNERIALLLYDAQKEFTGSESIMLQAIHSVMCAPLTGKEGLLGAIYVDRRDLLSRFEEVDLELLLAIAAQTAVAIENTKARDQLQKEAVVRERLGRFLPAGVVDRVMKGEIKLGGVSQEVTTLFADIRGFTPMSEKAEPETVVEVLNEHFTIMTDAIVEFGGTLDKYIGDSVMALFGAPTCNPETDPLNAVNAAILMQQGMRVVNDALLRRGLPTIQIGIGINTGRVIVGEIGSEKQMNYTAIGDAVNLAARLEANAKPGQILVSGPTSRLLRGAFALNPLPPIKVKGKELTVEVFEVAWGG